VPFMKKEDGSWLPAGSWDAIVGWSWGGCGF
jgi:hypothetical protein